MSKKLGDWLLAFCLGGAFAVVFLAFASVVFLLPILYLQGRLP